MSPLTLESVAEKLDAFIEETNAEIKATRSFVETRLDAMSQQIAQLIAMHNRSTGLVDGGGGLLNFFCRLDNAQGVVDALSAVPCQDAVVEIAEHGVVVAVEEPCCLRAKVYLKRELFAEYEYEYTGRGRPRFGLNLRLLVDSLQVLSRQSSAVEIRFLGPDTQLLLRSVGPPDACLYANIQTRLPETISSDFHFEHAGNTPITFTIKSAVLKETMDNLKWPASSITISIQPTSVTFKGEGHGDLQIKYPFYDGCDILSAIQCDRATSHRYNCMFLCAAIENIPSSEDNSFSKVTIGRGGMLKIQHLISVCGPYTCRPPPSQIAHVEFYVKPVAHQ